MNMVWEKLYATWRNQGSLHTRILGNFQNTVYWCNLKLAQEKRPAIFLPNKVTSSRSLQHTARSLHWESGTRRFAQLQDCHGLYSKQIRIAVNKINETKTKDHLGTHQANQRVTEETWNNAVHNRIPGIPLSTVEQQDTKSREQGQEVDREVREPQT